MFAECLSAGLVMGATYITLAPVFPKLLGNVFLFDILSSAYFIHVFALSGTVSGLMIAVMAIFGWGIAIRLFRKWFGYEKAYVNGSSNAVDIFAALIGTGISWFKRALTALFTRSPMEAPNEYYEWSFETVKGHFY